MEIGKRITNLREHKGLTTNKLAITAGISQSYLRDIELGNKNPTVEMLSYICDALNISLCDFFTIESNEIEPSLKKSLKKLSYEQQIKLAEFITTLKLP